MALAHVNCTVVVPTRNRLPQLKRCLDSLLVQTYQPFCILVVDDASTDGTREYLDQLKNPQIAIVHTDNREGAAGSRNIGIKQAQTEIVAFIDDDCIARPDWLQHLIGAFTDPQIAFAFGRTYYVSEMYRGRFPEKVVTNSKGNWPAAGNIAFRKSVFQAIGFFNPEFERFHNEDTEFAIRAVTKGFQFKKAAEAIVCHQQAQWKTKSLLASAKNASVFVLLKKLYPNHYRHFGSPIWLDHVMDPADYLLIIFFPLIFPILLVRYLLNGKRDILLFIIKWPVVLLFKRYWIYHTAIRCRVWML